MWLHLQQAIHTGNQGNHVGQLLGAVAVLSAMKTEQALNFIWPKQFIEQLGPYLCEVKVVIVLWCTMKKGLAASRPYAQRNARASEKGRCHCDGRAAR
jgi:hypothetical protein